MKRTIQLFSTAVIMLFCTFAFFSCKETETHESQLIAVTEGDINVSWEGGPYTILYEVENPTPTGELKPFTSAEWITDFFAGSYGEVKFNVAENPEETSRTATVRLEYEEQYLEFNVIQEGKDEMGNSDFKIEIDEITTSSIHVNVVPTDESMTYIVLCSDMESMVGFEDDEVLFDDVMRNFEEMSDLYQMPLEEIMATYMLTGEYDDTFSDLFSATEYCVFVLGIDPEEYTLLTPIARASATTKTIESTDVTFNITVEPKFTGTGSGAVADIVISPSDTEAKYFYLLLSQFEYDIYGAAMPDAVEGYLDYLLNYWSYNGDTPDVIYEQYSLSGRVEFSEDVEPRSNYWIGVFTWDEECNITSEIAWEAFNAPGNDSDNIISLSVEDVTSTSAKFVTTTTNDDPYWIGIQPASVIAGWDDEYLMWALIDYYDIASEVVTGDQVKIFEDLAPETDYVAIAFGFDGNSWTTDLTRVDFKTTASGDPSKCTFSFNVENLAPRGADVTVVPSDPGVSYYWDLYEGDATEDDIKGMIQGIIDSQIAAGRVTSALEFWQMATVRGENSGSWTTLTPNSTYKVMAVAIDMTVGDFAGDFAFGTFTTPEAVVSDATVTLDCTKYYDGDALYEYDPDKYSAFRGKAYTDIQASVSGPVEHYYYSVFAYSEGYEDPEVFSDEDVIYNLVDLYKGQVDRESAQWLLNWDTEYIVIGIAVDANGNYGKSYRERFTPVKGNASPIEEIVGGANAKGIVIPSSVVKENEAIIPKILQRR